MMEERNCYADNNEFSFGAKHVDRYPGSMERCDLNQMNWLHSEMENRILS